MDSPDLKLTLLPLLALPLIALGVTGCTSSDDDVYHSIGRKAVRTAGLPPMYDISDDDAQIERAERRARRTVGTFITALRSPGPGQGSFQVKKTFVREGVVEHIWLADVTIKGRRFVGKVDNKPEKIAGVNLGDQESVNPDEIDDWLYVDNGRMVGGYTVRALFAELSPQEQQDFEKQTGFRIEAAKR